MANEIDLDDLIKRVCAMEEEALGIRALDVLADRLDQTPYMTNGLGDFAYDTNSEDMQADVYVVRMRLIIGHVTEGYKGQTERVLRKHIPVLRAFFAAHVGLTATKFPEPPDYLSQMGATLTGGIGTAYFQEPGIPMQVGTEFRLRVPVDTDIEFDERW
jgi:hypothetical protein